MLIPTPAPHQTPCSETCVHADCISARQVAATPCARCRQPIGYARHYRRLSTGYDILEHHWCPTEGTTRHTLTAVVADVIDSLDSEIVALTCPHVPGLPDGWGRCEIVADDLRAIRQQLAHALKGRP